MSIVICVSQNQDGRLEIFYVGMNDTIYHNWQRSPNSVEWYGEEEFKNKRAKQICVGKNLDGRLEIFYVGTNDTIYHNWQKAPNSVEWHGEEEFKNDRAKQICVGQNQDGRLEIFYVGMNDIIYHNWQKAPNSVEWHGEEEFKNDRAKQICVGQNQDGRLEIFSVDMNDIIYHNWQKAPNSVEWYGEEDFKNNKAKQICVGKNLDGRLEIFYVGTNDTIYHNWQKTPNSVEWHGEEEFKNDRAKQICLGRNQDGRLEIFYVGTNDTIYHNWQKAPNRDWHGEEDFKNNRAKQICVGQNQDGRLEIFYVGMNDIIYHNWQKTPNKDWHGEEYLVYRGYQKWMEIYGSIIGHLPLNNLTLVCTHDSGTYDMVNSFVDPWKSCQQLNIEHQLNLGVRVLDLRIGMQNNESGDERFIFIHENDRTNTTLKNGLEQVKSFLERNKKEVIILDFHQFKSLGDDNFNENELYNVVINTLGYLIYPYQNKIPTLNEIWDTTHRVVVAWNTKNELPTLFFKGVNQKWEEVKNKGDLYKFITKEMEIDHESCGLWSICAVITPYLDGMQSLPELEIWFQVGCKWAQRANIVAVNLVQETAIVQQTVSECLIKGYNARIP